MMKFNIQMFGGRGATSGSTLKNLKVKEEKIRKEMVKIYNENSGFSRIDIKSVANALDKWNKLRKQANDIRTKINAKEEKTKKRQNNEKSNSFVNAYGEATKREITNATYKRQQSKMQKQVLRNLGYK